MLVTIGPRHSIIANPATDSLCVPFEEGNELLILEMIRKIQMNVRLSRRGAHKNPVPSHQCAIDVPVFDVVVDVITDVLQERRIRQPRIPLPSEPIKESRPRPPNK